MKQQILIVDDEMPIRRLLEKMFCNDYEVFCAADGIEALEIIRKQNISLIISDQRMPRMCGVEMFEKIASTHPHITKILLSGYIEKDDLQYALENDLIYKFISKPWKVSELKTIVADVMEVCRNNRIEQTAPAI